MLEQAIAIHDVEPADREVHSAVPWTECRADTADLAALLAGLPMQRRIVHAKEHLFHAGQPRHFLHLVRSGCFKTCIVSEDGREKVTGFRMRGDVLGLDALDMPTYACDAVALDTGAVWELPYAPLCDDLPGFQGRVTAMLAAEIRRDWSWMLAVGTLSADERVATFLLDLAARMADLGFSSRRLMLRMTRAELGSFLALTLETVTRALTRLQSRGLIGVAGREIDVRDAAALRASLPGQGAL